MRQTWDAWSVKFERSSSVAAAQKKLRCNCTKKFRCRSTKKSPLGLSANQAGDLGALAEAQKKEKRKNI